MTVRCRQSTTLSRKFGGADQLVKKVGSLNAICQVRTVFIEMTEFTVSHEELRVMLEAGYVLREAARFDEAERVFRGAIEFLPDSEIPHVALGTVFLQKGDFARAAAICQKALDINPASSFARVHYAEALLFSGRRDDADDELRSVIENDPDAPAARTARALIEAADLIAPKTSS